MVSGAGSRSLTSPRFGGELCAEPARERVTDAFFRRFAESADLGLSFQSVTVMGVAPRAGAWIETYLLKQMQHGLVRRPPRGGVD